RSGVMPRIMSPTAVSVTEAPAVDGRGSGADRGVGALVARVAAGRSEVVAKAVAVSPGIWPKEQAGTASAPDGPRIAKSPLCRLRPNITPDGAACGDVEPDTTALYGGVH